MKNERKSIAEFDAIKHIPLVKTEDSETLILKDGKYIMIFDVRPNPTIKSCLQDIYCIRCDSGSMYIDRVASYFPTSGRLEFNDDSKPKDIGKIRSLIKKWECVVDNGYIPTGQNKSSLKCLTSGKFFMYLSEKFSQQNIYTVDYDVSKLLAEFGDDNKKIKYVMSVMPTAGNSSEGRITKYTELDTQRDYENLSAKDERDLRKLIDMWLSNGDEENATTQSVENNERERDVNDECEPVSLGDGFSYFLQILAFGILLSLIFNWFSPL